MTENHTGMLPCSIVSDLMPLVADGVASEESRAAVMSHIEGCDDCRALWEAWQSEKNGVEQIVPAPLPDDKAIRRGIRQRIALLFGFAAVCGAAAGVIMLDSPLVFQNFLIMPLVGALAFASLGKRGLWVCPLIWLMALVYGLIHMNESGDLWGALVYGGFFVALALVGAVIAALLRFALKPIREAGGIQGGP